jgi:uncharacterized protein (DUF4415 family)
MEKEKNKKRFSAAELEDLRAGGKSRTDLTRVRSKTEAELESDIESDREFRDETRDWVEAAEAIMPIPKKLLSLRIDADVVAWFKARGPGYQTRINAVLRAFVE